MGLGYLNAEAKKMLKWTLLSEDFNKENYNIMNHVFLLWDVRKDCNKIPTSCQSCLSFMGLDGAGIFSTCWKKEFMDKGGNPCIPSHNHWKRPKGYKIFQGFPRQDSRCIFTRFGLLLLLLGLALYVSFHFQRSPSMWGLQTGIEHDWRRTQGTKWCHMIVIDKTEFSTKQ